MSTGDVVALIGAGVVAPLIVAAVVGMVKWGGAVNRALATLVDLAGDVRDLAEAVRGLGEFRAEFRAHVHLADDRWASLGGIIPHPRFVTADDRPDRRRSAATAVGE